MTFCSLGLTPEAAVALGEVDPGQPGVELGAEELGGRRVGRRVLGQEPLDGLGDALGVGPAVRAVVGSARSVTAPTLLDRPVKCQPGRRLSVDASSVS